MQLGKQFTFTAPSGYVYTIREQHGGDDDIMSNVSDAKNLMNFSKFIAAIVVDTDVTVTRTLTPEEAHYLPALDRDAILFYSRIHSIGETVEFEYDWAEEGGKIQYSQDLNEYLFDYSKPFEESMISEKPDAIPYYPLGKASKNLEFTTTTGKKVRFNLLDGAAEAFLILLPIDQQSKNKALEARKLSLFIEDTQKWDIVKDWSFFTRRELDEIRKYVAGVDPVFSGKLVLPNPGRPGLNVTLSIVGIPDFFYPGEN